MNCTNSARSDEEAGGDDPDPRWWEWLAIIVASFVIGALESCERCWSAVRRRIGKRDR
jgi:hypothetical protein